MLAWLFTGFGGNLSLPGNNWIFNALLAEFVFTLIYVLVFLIQTERETRFSRDTSIWTLIIGGAYGVCVTQAQSSQAGCLNPAYGLAVNLTQVFDYGGVGMKYIWIWLLFPLLGAVCALLFHEFVFKKAQEGADIDYEERESLDDPMLG